MSYSVGGFSGDNALLAFAALQQGRMNEEMTAKMQDAEIRSQMASDLATIKSHLEVANRHPEQPEKFQEVDDELQAFMAKYGAIPELDEVTQAVGEIASNVHGKRSAGDQAALEQYQRKLERGPSTAPMPDPSYTTGKTIYATDSIKNWLSLIDEKLSASGTNEQLAMIHIKQLNDNINNSSGTVSGIIESRSNAMASIINNIA